MNLTSRKILIIAITILVMPFLAHAQSTFKVDLDMRPRFEYRHGFNNLIPGNPNSKDASVFVRQRSRVNISYDRLIEGKKLKTFMSLQDVSTWGDTRQILPSDDNDSFSLFQAWMEYFPSENYSIKAGRQIISYDDQRIFGGLDWAMQGRFHDALLLKRENENSHIHVGLAVNSAGEPNVEEAYLVNGFFSYKYMQYLHYNRKIGDANLSLLVLNNMFQETITVSTGPVTIFPNGTYSRTTMGIYYKQPFGKFNVESSTYTQFGDAAPNVDLSSYQFMLNLGYKTGKVSFGAGIEMLSGTNQEGDTEESQSFFPLYGTNHKFNGFMDYFYVGNHANSVGLNDLNLNVNFPALKGKILLKGHYFASNAKIKDNDNYLGTEVDLVYSKSIAKDIGIKIGYSQMFASNSMNALKNVTRGNENTNNWAWIMVKVNPTIFMLKHKSE